MAQRSKALNAGRKRKPRLKSTKDSDLHEMYGQAPVFKGGGIDDVNYRIDLINAINWTSRGVEPKDARKELAFWMEENEYNKADVKAIKALPDYELVGQGRLAYLLNNGWPIELDAKNRLKDKISAGVAKGKELAKEKATEDRKKKKESKIREETKANPEAINLMESVELTDAIEDQVFATYKIDEDRVQALAKGRKAVVLTKAMERLGELKEDLELYGEDEQVTEGYSFLKKTQVRKIKDALDSAISTLEGAKINKTAGRKRRSSKPKSAAVQVKRFKFKEKDPNYNLVSLQPIELIGAIKAVVFNTKTRKLGIYYAKDQSGFTAKGTTLQNFDESVSEQKTLRDTKDSKITDKLVEFRKAPVKKVDKLFEELSTTNTKMNGRFNNDTVILKVYKK